MIVVTPNKTLDWSGKRAEQILEAWHELFKELLHRDEIVQEVLIDGVSFREGYNEYMLQYISTIKQVEIKTVREKELIREIEDELKNYLPKIIRALDSIPELFYGEMGQEEWSHVAKLTEGMQWAAQAAHVIRQHLERRQGRPLLLNAIIRFETESGRLSSELESAMDRQDYTAIGDQLKYEWPDVFNALLEQLDAEVLS